jgi:hypothetical protein
LKRWQQKSGLDVKIERNDTFSKEAVSVEKLDTLLPQDPIKAYKTILAEIIGKRPSGTRQRLADALGKHRSFISQITGAGYTTPLPEKHLSALFSVCHFTADERLEFLSAYDLAHPDKTSRVEELRNTRHISLTVKDFGDDEKNRRFDEAIVEFANRVSGIFSDSPAPVNEP